MNGNNDDLKGILERAQNPSDAARTALIKQLLGEGAQDEKLLASIKSFALESKSKVEQERVKLRAMNPVTASLKDIEAIIAEADKLSGIIGQKTQETEDTNDRVEERRKKWKAFEDQFGEK